MPGGRKTTWKEQAIACLLTEPTLQAAAAKAGISERTLQLWLTQLDFLAAYRGARGRVVEAAVAKLQRASGRAVGALERNLTCGIAAAANRAALAILEQGHRLLDATELEERIAALERQRAKGAPWG
jgi:hypothetical protein